MWGRGADDIWVVGRYGQIAHYDGQSWTASASGTNIDLRAIDGTASTVWIVGQEVALRSRD